MNRKTLVVAAAVGAIAVSGGAAFALAANGDPLPAGAQPTATSDPTSDPTSATATSSGTSTATPTAAPGELTADDAARIVRERLGGGTVHEIEREFEHGRTEWEVEITKDGVSYEVRVDARTGDITRIEQDDRRGGRDGDDDHGDDHGDDHSDDHSDDHGDGHGGHGGNDGPGDDKGGDR